MNLAVFASGGGSNFQSILDAAADGALPARIRLLVSDRPEAGALDRAERAGLDHTVIDPDTASDAAAYGDRLLRVLDAHGVDFVALAGFLRKIPPAVVERFRTRMVNIHPALLPSFGGEGMYGHHVHEAAITYGVRWSGVTVHLVDEEYDHGPVVQQVPVPRRPQDAPEDLADRVLRYEHRLYPETLRLFAEGKIRIEGRTVHVEEHPPPDRRLAAEAISTGANGAKGGSAD